MRLAVVGHVEWVRFARVERLPQPGDILHAAESWEEPAGGGGVTAVRLARLGGSATLFTALGDDEVGHRTRATLEELGVRVEAAFRPTPQRLAFTFVDRAGERTITTIGERLDPSAAEQLAWDDLEAADGVYFTAGDGGALRAARRGRVLVATSRVLDRLGGVRLDALVGSARDPAEAYEPGDLSPPPDVVVATSGGDGGSYRTADGRVGTFQPAPLPGPARDAYGAGDSFAAGLTFALARGDRIDGALAFAAREGAEAMTRRGAHG
jgi:ribokinase